MLHQVSLGWNITTTAGATLNSDSSFTLATDPLYLMKNDLKCAQSVLHTSPLLLRRYWADWRKLRRNNNAAVAGSALYCTDDLSPPLLFKAPRTNALVRLNWGCPLSLRLIIISSDTSFHETVWFVNVRSVPFFLQFPVRGMTNVLEEIFWRMQQHLKNSSYELLCFPNQCHSTSTWRWFDPWTFQAELIYSAPSFFGIPEVIVVLCVVGNFPTRTRLVLHQYGPILDILKTMWTTQILSFQDFTDRGYSATLPRQSTESEKAYAIAVDSLHRPVVQRSGSYPWNCSPINCRNAKWFSTLILDQVLWNIKQLFDLLEVRVLGGT